MLISSQTFHVISQINLHVNEVLINPEEKVPDLLTLSIRNLIHLPFIPQIFILYVLWANIMEVSRKGHKYKEPIGIYSI